MFELNCLFISIFWSYPNFHGHVSNCIRKTYYIDDLPIVQYVSFIVHFVSVYTNIPSSRRDEFKTSFPLQEGMFVYS